MFVYIFNKYERFEKYLTTAITIEYDYNVRVATLILDTASAAAATATGALEWIVPRGRGLTLWRIHALPATFAKGIISLFCSWLGADDPWLPMVGEEFVALIFRGRTFCVNLFGNLARKNLLRL